jgi:cation diffusion facilitator family transporter
LNLGGTGGWKGGVVANEASRPEERGTKRIVYAALAANLLIAASKFVAGFASGSSAMLAEGVHSVADTVNQGFLLVGLRTSKRDPDEEHPFGHGQDQFFWAFLVAVLIFFAGGGFAIYQGIMRILGESAVHGSLLINYLVLGGAFVLEGSALAISTREFRRAARAEGHPFWEHFQTTPNITMKVPLYEDVAALTGLLIAAVGLLLLQVTGNEIFDGLASLCIGLLLLVVAWELGTDSRRLLIGEAILPEDRRRVREVMLSFPEVTDVLRLLTMYLGPDSVLVTAEIHVVDEMDTDGIEELLERVSKEIRREVPEVTQTFIEPHPAGREGRL